ncbi:MAG: hypothetical protein EOO50_09430 [Flavobacterium sp.]|uniref:hypothetical protein n=1 Tax=Flavobacterium sp. TaxID=239 RepID=UPI00122A178B|nr:hypothetical protein [Flavobacterium sp.]RZJ66583.1 MAG: hypothetical protein EOO50_09430 [Flavobacterium sp.]
MRKIVLFILPCILMSACVSEETCKEDSVPLSATTPIRVGETLKLYAETGATVVFHWIGPNGFESYEKDPVLNFATQNMSGTYSMTPEPYFEECVAGPATTVEVVVNPAVASCNTTTNSVSLPTSTMSFYYVDASFPQDDFQLTANGSNGDLYIDFDSDQLPAAGVYNVCQTCNESGADPNEMRISLITAQGFDNYHQGLSGEIFISYIGDKISATFCDVQFTDDIIASGNITEL